MGEIGWWCLNTVKRNISHWSKSHLRLGKNINGLCKLWQTTNDNRLEWENFKKIRLNLPSKQFFKWKFLTEELLEVSENKQPIKSALMKWGFTMKQQCLLNGINMDCQYLTLTLKRRVDEHIAISVWYQMSHGAESILHGTMTRAF